MAVGQNSLSVVMGSLCLTLTLREIKCSVYLRIKKKLAEKERVKVLSAEGVMEWHSNSSGITSSLDNNDNGQLESLGY